MRGTAFAWDALKGPFIAIVIFCVKLLAWVLHRFIYRCIRCELSLITVNWNWGLWLKHSILFVIKTWLIGELLSIWRSSEELKCFRLIQLLFIEFTGMSELFYRLLIIDSVVWDLRPAWSSWRPTRSFHKLPWSAKVIEGLWLWSMTSSLLVHLIDEEVSGSVSTVKKVVVVLLQRIPFLLCYSQTFASKLIFQFLPLDLHCSIVPLCIEGSLFNYLMNNALSCILKNNRNFFLWGIKFLQRLFFIW